MSGSDSDNDLFAEETQEEIEARQAKAKLVEEAINRASKKELLQKSSIIVDVSPEDVDVDLDEVANIIRSKKIDGLDWGETVEKIPIGFGVNKLRIIFTIYDAKVDGNQIEDIFESEELEGLVSSHEIVSWNKL